MRIRLAKTAGFCMGVRRAVEIAQEAAAAGPVYTLGPLIHNRQAVEALEQHGVKAVDSVEGLEPGRIVIRAHGIARAARADLEARGFDCIDATCPRVLASHGRLRSAAQAGRHIVLVGDPDHAEMVGLAGQVDGAVDIISSLEEARALLLERPVTVVAQTTFSARQYSEIAAWIGAHCPDCEVYDSICNATAERQAEVRALAAACDAVVVVGGRHSANTLRLAEIVAAEGRPAYHVETAAELDTAALASYRVVGVTAGASTPGWLTQTVIDRVQAAGQRGLAGQLRALLSGVARTYFYSAVGAACLAWVVHLLLALEPIHPIVLFQVFAYIFTIYTLNRRLTIRISTSVLSDFDAFYDRHKKELFLAAGVLAAASLAVAVPLGAPALILLALAYFGGTVYALPLLPRRFHRRRLKDIPASKDVFVATAWSSIVVGLPALTADALPDGVGLAAAFGVVFLTVFAKTAALDLRDTEGDRLIGSETLPILIGSRRTVRLMFAVHLLVLGLLILFTAIGVFQPVGWLLCLLPVYAMAYLVQFSRRRFGEEVHCQLVVDGQFLLAGVLGLVAEWLL